MGSSLVLSAAWGPLGSPLAWAAAWLLKIDPDGRPLGGCAAARSPLRRRPDLGMGPGILRVTRTGHSGPLATTKMARFGASDPTRLVAPRRHLVSAGGLDRAGLAARREPRPADATLEAEFLAVGHGLAVLIHTPDGQTLLYDCGRLGDPTVGRRIIAPRSGHAGSAASTRSS